MSINGLIVGWDVFKQFLSDRNVVPQYIDLQNAYYLLAFDNQLHICCYLDKEDTDNINDFETNFKSSGNKNIKSEVTTQFEKRDKTLKLAHGEAEVGEDGLHTIMLRIPGEAGSGDGRWISSGMGFFGNHNSGDKILGVYFVDHDNILGMGADTIVGSYTDDDAAEGCQGWAIPPSGWVKAEAIGGYGFAPSGFYIKVIGKKADGADPDIFYCNFEWGRVES